LKRRKRDALQLADLTVASNLQIMMVIYLLNSERASDAWPELGIVIRQAVAMGLHIDPLQLYPDLPFKDAEVRRRVWYVDGFPINFVRTLTKRRLRAELGGPLQDLTHCSA